MIRPELLLPLVHFEKSKQDMVDSLCEPLSLVGISNFGYTKVTRDRDFFRIGNCLPFTEMAHKNDWANSPYGANGLFNDCTFDGDRKTIISLWNVDENPLTQQRRLIDVWNGVTIYRINPDYLEIFSLGGTLQDTELPNFIVNNIDHMKRFFTYFKTQAGDLLDTSETGMTVKVPFFETEDQQRKKAKHQLELFMSKIAEKTTLSIGGQLVNLSRRELECLIYRHQGLSAKEMASCMGISRRTVETYFENIKAKSGLGKINQVLSICRDEGLI